MGRPKKALAIPFFLKGKADRVYQKLSEEDKKVIKKVLDGIETGCTQSKEALLSVFYACRPRAGESIYDFAVSLQELLSAAIPSMQDTEKFIVLRQQLCAHLPSYMKALIQFNANKSWDDLLVALQHSGSIINDYDANSRNFKTEHLPIKEEEIEMNYISRQNNIKDRSSKAHVIIVKYLDTKKKIVGGLREPNNQIQVVTIMLADQTE